MQKHPSLDFLIDLFPIVRCGLVNKIVEPVGIEQICTASPGYDGFKSIVVVREVIYGDLDGKSGVLIAEIFGFESTRIIFGMTRDEYLSASIGSAGIKSCHGRSRKYLQFGASLHVLNSHSGVA